MAPEDTTGRTPGRPLSADVENRVSEATLRLVAEDGFDRLSAERIAAAAGVPKSTIYRRWGGALPLVTIVLQRYLATSSLELPDTGSLRGDLLAANRSLAKWLMQPVIRRSIVSAIVAMQRDAELREFVSAVDSGRQRLFGRLISRAIGRGELAADVDRERIVELLWAPIFKRLMYGEDIGPEFADEVVERVLDGVERRPG